MKNGSWMRFVMKNGSCGKIIALVLLSVIIMVILAGIVMVNNVSPGRGENARTLATRAMMKSICTATEMYKTANGVLPDNLEQLEERVEAMYNFRIDKPLHDGWGTPFRYTKIDEGTFEVRSAGPDEVMDTKDDITN